MFNKGPPPISLEPAPDKGNLIVISVRTNPLINPSTSSKTSPLFWEPQKIEKQ